LTGDFGWKSARSAKVGLAFVTNGLKEAGEQWTDESKQGMVSTIMIQCMRDGAIGIWNRGAK
jgi:hypothetical protein